MSIRQEYDKALDYLMEREGTSGITVSLTLSATEWRAMFQEIPMGLRLKLHTAMMQRRKQEEAAEILARG